MIQKSVLLRCSPIEAFHLFTTRISEWWPLTHRPSKDPHSELVLEASGRFHERAADGRDIDLGRVVEWDPPRRLMLDFYMGTSADQPTAVEILFVPEGEATRVTVYHRSKPESAHLWTRRVGVFENSWQSVLQSLVNW